MTFLELVHQIAQRTSLPSGSVQIVLRALGEEVTDAVMSGERIVYRGFGVFYPVKIKVTDKVNVPCKITKVRFKGSRRTMEKYQVEYEANDERPVK